jgi:hypothetical protein
VVAQRQAFVVAPMIQSLVGSRLIEKQYGDTYSECPSRGFLELTETLQTQTVHLEDI